jgi:uncharacterized protein YukJ
VDVHSVDGSDIRYLIVPGFTPPDGPALDALPLGVTALTGANGGLRLDYVRQRINGLPMVDPSQMVDLPIGDARDPLRNAVAQLLNAALADPNGTIYAFGSSFEDSGTEPGIHDIHMNQGNPPGRFQKDNGAWQDGALFIELPEQPRKWTAIFIAFQSESFHTDDNGDPH